MWLMLVSFYRAQNRRDDIFVAVTTESLGKVVMDLMRRPGSAARN
jgi:hypothetical protein